MWSCGQRRKYGHRKRMTEKRTSSQERRALSSTFSYEWGKKRVNEGKRRKGPVFDCFKKEIRRGGHCHEKEFLTKELSRGHGEDIKRALGMRPKGCRMSQGTARGAQEAGAGRCPAETRLSARTNKSRKDSLLNRRKNSSEEKRGEAQLRQ